MKRDPLGARIAVVLPYLFLTLAIACVFVSLYLEQVYGNDLFQRSGAFVILLALLIQVSTPSSTNSSARDWSFLRETELGHEAKEHANIYDRRIVSTLFRKIHEFWSFTALVMTIFGTAIWGYGDLILKAF